MSTIAPVLLITIGFLLLIKGADWMITGAAALARKSKISDLAIGLTIVAFGTSAPELVVNIVASVENEPDIIFGNVIGSNNFNLFLILGIVGLIFPIVVQSNTVWKEIPISFLAIMALFLLANAFFNSGEFVLSRLDGCILLILFVLFILYVYMQLKADESEAQTAIVSLSTYKIWGYIIVGLAGLILGGQLVVTNAMLMAANFGMSEKIIGLTIVAMGTSLPEYTCRNCGGRQGICSLQ